MVPETYEQTADSLWRRGHAEFARAGAGNTATARREAADRYQQKLAALAELGGSIAHEVNNLMLIISARVLLAHASTGVPDRVGSHLSAIDQAAERTREVTRSLLSLLRPEQPERHQIDVGSLAHEAAALFRRLLPASIRVRADAAVPGPTMHANPDQIRQALLHLAVRAKSALCESGELVIAVEAYDTNSGALGNGWLRLSVWHTAPGEHASHLDPQSASHHVAVVAGIARAHGGRLLASASSEGAQRFDLLLPGHHLAAAPGPAAPARTQRPPAGSDRWLLLVTADDAVRRNVADAMISSGWSLVTVPSLESAQPRPFGDENKPAGVIIDLAAARPDQLKSQLGNASENLPCLLVGSSRPTSSAQPREARTERHPGARHRASKDEQSIEREVVQRWLEHLAARRTAPVAAGRDTGVEL